MPSNIEIVNNLNLIVSQDPYILTSVRPRNNLVLCLHYGIILSTHSPNPHTHTQSSLNSLNSPTHTPHTHTSPTHAPHEITTNLHSPITRHVLLSRSFLFFPLLLRIHNPFNESLSSGNDYCYQLRHQGYVWERALEVCNGSLLYLDEEKEFNFVKNVILEPHGERSVIWLAGKKLAQGK